VTGRDYSQLVALHQKYQPRGLAVLAFPCNQFGRQEPGTNREIKEFATHKYHVKFDLFAKVEVNGPRRHPVYVALAAAMPGALVHGKIKGNFNEFLVDGRGLPVKHYPKRTPPVEAEQDIVALLAGSGSGAHRV
jgi:glutathione peroxidase